MPGVVKVYTRLHSEAEVRQADVLFYFDGIIFQRPPTILSCNEVFRQFQRKNKKRNFDGIERSVQNSVYTASLCRSREFYLQELIVNLLC